MNTNTANNSLEWKILIIDDDEDDYILTWQMLSDTKRGKYILDWSSSYEEARAALQKDHYDAVLMDYDLGAHNGLELIREATAAGYRAPFILFTGRGSYEVDVEAMQAGASLYLTKGETSALMLERGIRYAIERKQVEQALQQANQDMQLELERRIQIEKALQENKDKYRLVADYTYDWEYWLSPENRFVYVSPACERITGYQKEEFLAKPELLIEITHPGDREQLSCHILEKEHSSLGSYEIDFRIQTRQGEVRWISHWCQSVYAQDGRWLGRRASNRDITDRKRMELDLLRSNERQSLLADAATALLAGADPIAKVDDFLERVSLSLGLEVCVQYNVAADGNHLILGKMAGIPEQYRKLLAILQFGQAVCGAVALARKPMYVNDVQRSKDRATRLIRSIGVESYACHPLIAEDRLLGTLSFGSRRHARFDPETIDLLRTFCSLVAMALARQQTMAAMQAANETLQQQAEELEVQAEELRAQTDELVIINEQLRQALGKTPDISETV